MGIHRFKKALKLTAIDREFHLQTRTDFVGFGGNMMGNVDICLYNYVYIAGWWFGTFFIFPYIGNSHPN